jgi:anti-sigma-K factor RskA
MARPEDLEELAAEFALGSLPEAERLEAEALLSSDPDFALLVDEWDRRLIPLALALEPVEAPPRIRGAVMKAIAGDGAESATVISLRRKASNWRWATLGASAVAASLAAFIAVGQMTPKPAGDQRFVAVLQAEGPGPAFLASIDLANGSISVRTVGAPPQPGKSYELWAVGGGRDKPQSLGVIDASFRIPASKLGAVDPKVLNDTLFAVSLEPEGGSPTGQATGPVLFTGKLVATE